MKRAVVLMVILMTLLSTQSALAQDEEVVECGSAETTAEDIIEEISAEMEADGEVSEDDAENLGELKALAEHPLDLNVAGEGDFAPLFFLSEHQVQSILQHRQARGSFKTVGELRDIDVIDAQTYRRLLAFVSVSPAEGWGRMPPVKVNSVWRVDRVYPKSKGYIPKNDSTPSAYVGPPYRLLMRSQLSVGRRWQAGVVMESDPGEPLFSEGTKATDFTSGYLMWADRGRFVQKAIVGHYSLRLGQGLGVWTGFSMNPSISANTQMRSAMGITPCTSANEYDYLRGAALQLGRGLLSATLYASSVRISVTTRQTADSLVYFSAIRTNGYHRTETERKYRHNDRVDVVGGYLRKSFYKTAFGVGYNVWHSSIPMGSGNFAYLQNRPDTCRVGTLHADFKTFLSKVAVYGEMASQGPRALGGVLSAELNMGDCNTLCVGVRRFSPSYYALVQKPLSATTHASDESGLFFGFTCAPLSRVSLRASVDAWRVRSPQYQHDAPLNACKMRLVLDKQVSRRSSLSLRVRHKASSDYLHPSAGQYAADTLDYARERITSYKALLTMAPSGHVVMHTLVERTHSHDAKDVSGDGMLFCQDFKLTYEVVTLNVSASYFSTDNYDCRVYTRQPNILYDMSFGSCSGEGVATCAMLKVVPVEWLRMWLWVRHLKYFDRESVGSGNDLIADATHKTQVKAQLQISIFRQRKMRRAAE